MNTEFIENNKGQERGNALFLILIAVALFAALSYAITQSGRGSGTVDRETVVITAGQVVEQPAAVRTAVTRLIITGVSAASVTFTGAASASDVFDTATGGGGATDLPPPKAACNTASNCASWTYLPAASTTTGFFIMGVGTVATDAIAYLSDVTTSVCKQIQKGLGLSTDIDAAKQKTAAFDPTTGSGAGGVYAAAGSATTIKSSDDTLDGQAFSCWENDDSDHNAYYHALIEQ